MANTTVLRNLAARKPKSDTQFHQIQAEVHRLRGKAGDGAWAKVHDQAIEDIRSGAQKGTSLSLCPKCLERGSRVIVIIVGESLKCGSCDWTGEERRKTERRPSTE